MTKLDIRAARLAVGLSQRQLAEHANVHQSTVSRIERGISVDRASERVIRVALAQLQG